MILRMATLHQPLFFQSLFVYISHTQHLLNNGAFERSERYNVYEEDSEHIKDIVLDIYMYTEGDAYSHVHQSIIKPILCLDGW